MCRGEGPRACAPSTLKAQAHRQLASWVLGQAGQHARRRGRVRAKLHVQGARLGRVVAAPSLGNLRHLHMHGVDRAKVDMQRESEHAYHPGIPRRVASA